MDPYYYSTVFSILFIRGKLTPFLVQLASSLLEPHSSNSVTDDDDDDNEINLFLAFLT